MFVFGLFCVLKVLTAHDVIGLFLFVFLVTVLIGISLQKNGIFKVLTVLIGMRLFLGVLAV